MKFHATPLQDAHLIELGRRGDDRGFFARFFCEQEFAQAGLESRYAQINNQTVLVNPNDRQIVYIYR